MQRVTITRAELVPLYEGGRSIDWLADHFGTSRATIWRRLREYGAPTRRAGQQLRPQSIVIPTDPAVLGYIAGLVDGEGNLQWRRRTNRANSAVLSIYSTTAEVMDWLVANLGGTTTWDHRRVERYGWKPIATWQIRRRRDLLALLSALMPHLIIKRDLAQTVIADLAAAR